MASIPCAYGYLHLAVKFFPNQAKRSLQKKKGVTGKRGKEKRAWEQLKCHTHTSTDKQK